MPNAVAATVTAEQIREFLDLEAERKALEQKARALGKRSQALGAHMLAYLERLGKDSTVRHGFRLSLIDGRPAVGWKDEFIRVAGPLAADEVLSNAPRPRRLHVEQSQSK